MRKLRYQKYIFVLWLKIFYDKNVLLYDVPTTSVKLCMHILHEKHINVNMLRNEGTALIHNGRLKNAVTTFLGIVPVLMYICCYDVGQFNGT